jgi:hypothetical protein
MLVEILFYIMFRPNYNMLVGIRLLIPIEFYSDEIFKQKNLIFFLFYFAKHDKTKHEISLQNV